MQLSAYTRAVAAAAAEHLTGRRVVIRWGAPDDSRYSGGTAGKAGAVGLLEVDCSGSPVEVWRIFTHEVAHLVLDFDTLPDDNIVPPVARVAAPLGFQRSTLARALYDARERRVEALAERWRAWGWERAAESTLEAALEALLEYPVSEGVRRG